MYAVYVVVSSHFSLVQSHLMDRLRSKLEIFIDLHQGVLVDDKRGLGIPHKGTHNKGSIANDSRAEAKVRSTLVVNRPLLRRAETTP